MILLSIIILFQQKYIFAYVEGQLNREKRLLYKFRN